MTLWACPGGRTGGRRRLARPGAGRPRLLLKAPSGCGRLPTTVGTLRRSGGRGRQTRALRRAGGGIGPCCRGRGPSSGRRRTAPSPADGGHHKRPDPEVDECRREEAGVAGWVDCGQVPAGLPPAPRTAAWSSARPRRRRVTCSGEARAARSARGDRTPQHYAVRPAGVV